MESSSQESGLRLGLGIRVRVILEDFRVFEGSNPICFRVGVGVRVRVAARVMVPWAVHGSSATSRGQHRMAWFRNLGLGSGLGLELGQGCTCRGGDWGRGRAGSEV